MRAMWRYALLSQIAEEVISERGRVSVEVGVACTSNLGTKYIPPRTNVSVNCEVSYHIISDRLHDELKLRLCTALAVCAISLYTYFPAHLTLP